MDIKQARQAKVVFAGLAAIQNGTTIHLEYPRVGAKVTGPLDEDVWLNPSRMLVSSRNIIHAGRQSESLGGGFKWNGRSEGIIEAVVRTCMTDAETEQTYLDVDIVAERHVNQDGRIATSLPTW